MEENIQPNDYIKSGIEAILFVSEKPINVDDIKKVFDTVAAAELKKIMQDLKEDYEKRDAGVQIIEIAGGYQMLTNSKYASYLKEFFKTRHKEKLSKPALETLAIVAYKQPVTRAEIEIIRGVNSDGVASHLLDKELIKAVGRKDVPGKPFLYGTTKQFLEYFGLKSLDNLPKLEEFPNLQPAASENIIPLEDGEKDQALSEVAQAQIQTSQESGASTSDTNSTTSVAVEDQGADTNDSRESS
jgi:segregation and condensation protein B